MESTQHLGNRFSLPLVYSLFLLMGCGGGGNNSGSFTDIPLIGLAYETETVRGVTDAKGFEFNDGETIRFSIGSTVLGTVVAQNELTVFDLASGAEPLVGWREVRGILQESSGPCVPFERVMNIATLIQTLDTNNDISDGVEISPSVATLLDGALVNLDARIYEFATDRAFRQALNAANEAELFAEHRQVRPLFAVVTAVYDGVGVDPQLYSGTRYETDRDADEVVDEFEEYTFDDRNLLVGEVRDSDAMGDPSFVLEISYDEFGRITKEQGDNDGNGVFDSESTLTYDIDGNLTNETSRDLLANTITQSTTRESNDFGKETVRRSDNDGDGVIDSEWRTRYDSEGRHIESTLDRGADGTIEIREITRYNSEGLVDRFTYDDGDDGTIDRTTTYEYNDRGQRIRTANERLGVGTNTTTFEYDADGNRISLEVDSDSDGIPERIQLNTYAAPGRWILEETDSDGDGTIDRIRTQTYSDEGDRLESTDDSNADGIVDFRSRYEYDEYGNQTLRESDSGDDGTVDSVDRVTYTKTGWAAFLSNRFGF